ncbi:hypothetical protein E5F05_10080 [Deinococcus metallilatus]|uniref:DMSO/TMAO reductase YedYZ heme-binding membrane subunit n=1 Tax=Deinococcus metallilatus TaxID=1211322 RepID=A0AAJ5F2C1_9DEIO|nr:ferric reductase-like transmembrane domain-containing protein [Deinococcus metallilatus]MBB5295908.1 DMSO/TMAO reductase YedYZ heme-binding membrane subunit [Deinococcus metallilatus]QBY08258.1 hypothetical protein E5F05_10080 [Deinococcus metallilatus]RXJ11989.1 hypothetical protein ERJ73_08890 [Deinococcus metallilatus]TLK25779.1 hypothetical protein FCS05_12090 [Deinococcus metallilatus]GMA14558.1 hypothetical protein GCM10025871_08890 [Deinococcus metallilatus]
MAPRPRRNKAATRRTTGRRATREAAPQRAVPGFQPFIIGVLVVVITEELLRVLYVEGSHLLGQRRTEVYGWLSLAALLLVLASRWLRLVPHRRALGLAGFAFALMHTWLAYAHVLDGDVENVLFLSVEEQAALWLGVAALLGLLPLALTSTNTAMRRLGKRWKALHRLGPWMTLLAALHTAWIGVHFGLNPLAWTSVALLLVSAALFLFRFPRKKVHP